MAIVEYKSDGSFRSFRNHYKRQTKEGLIRELWESAGEEVELRRENARLNKLYIMAVEGRNAFREAYADAARLLRRYRNETPLGHQPHMIANQVDAILTEEEREANKNENG